MDPKIEKALNDLRHLYYSGKRGKNFGIVNCEGGLWIQDPRCVGLKEDLNGNMIARFFCDMACGVGNWFKQEYRLPYDNSYSLYISKETFSVLFKVEWYHEVPIVYSVLFDEKWYREN